MRAPILTKRESEIIEYLAVGATREEIAKTLGVSPETVKLHTKNILRKFNVSSVRDGAADIQDFVRAYGKDGLGHQIFNTDVAVSVVVDPLCTSAKWNIVSTGYVVSGVVEHLSLATIKHNQIESLRLNGKIPELVSNSMSFVEFKLPLENPIQQGGAIIRTTEFTEIAAADTKINEVSFITGTPCHNLTINVEFLGDKTYQTAPKVIAGLKTQEISDNPDISFKQNDNITTLSVKNPPIEIMYIVMVKE
jgi:hypothetical protein